MADKEPPRQSMTVRLSREAYETLRKIAYETHVPMVRLIEQAIEVTYLEGKEMPTEVTAAPV